MTQGQAGGAAGQGPANLFASLGTGFSPSLGIRPGGAAAAAAAPAGGPSLLEAQGPAASVTPRSAPPTEFPMHAEVVAVSTDVSQRGGAASVSCPSAQKALPRPDVDLKPIVSKEAVRRTLGAAPDHSIDAAVQHAQREA